MCYHRKQGRTNISQSLLVLVMGQGYSLAKPLILDTIREIELYEECSSTTMLTKMEVWNIEKDRDLSAPFTFLQRLCFHYRDNIYTN